MKKKFVKGLLMAAIAVAPMSFLTSCTDHEDDRFAELQIWLSDPNNLNIKDLIAKEIGDLENRIKELEDAQRRCEQNCSTIHANLNQFLTIVEGDQRYLQIADWNTYINSIYTKAEIDRLLDGLKQCTCEKFTREDIQNIINQYLANNQYITRQDVQNIINNFLKEYYTKTEVENLLKNYITNEYLTQNFYTKEEVMNIINNLPQDDLTDLLNRIAALEGKDVYTKSEVNDLLNGKVDKAILDNYYDKTKVLELIKDFVTEEQVHNIIEGYGYLTREEIIALIRQYASGSGVTMNEVKNYLTQYYYTMSDIRNLLNNYYDKATVDQMFAKIGDTSNYGNAVSLEDVFIWIGTKYYDREQIDNLIKDFITKETAIQTILDEVKNAQSELSQAIITLINTYQYKWGDNETITIQQAIDSLYKVKNNISCACGYTSAIGDMVQQNNSDIDSLARVLTIVRDSVYTLNVNIGNLNTELGQVKQTAEDAKAKAEAVYKTDSIYNVKVDSIINVLNNLVINNCTCDLTGLTNSLDSLKEATSNLADKVDRDSAAIAALNDRIDALDYVTHQELKEGLDSVADALNTRINEVDSIYKSITDKLQDQIDELKPQVEKNAAAIDSIFTHILPTLATKEWVQEQLAKQVTSISIEGAYSPVLGEGAAPLGVQLNLLAVYHGEALSDIVFPGNTNLSNPEENVFTAEDAAILRQAGFRTRYQSEAGNIYYGKDEKKPAYAGKLYFTINPNTVDFSGINLTMENSLGWQPGVTLSNVAKSDHKLSFGYTRADNGFYEADAEIDMSQIGNIQARVNLSDFKDVAKNLKNVRTEGINVTKLITTIYSSLSDVLDRYAIAAEYTDANGAHKTYSRYDLAATAVKPLGFHSVPLESYAQKDIPGLDLIEEFYDNLIDRLIGIVSKVVDKAIDTIDRDALRIDKLETEDATLYYTVAANAVTITFAPGTTVQQVTWWETDDDGRNAQLIRGTATLNADGSVTVAINIADLIRRLYIDISDPVSAALDVVNDVLDRFENFEDYAERYTGEVKDFIWKYVDKINSRFQRYMDPNKYLATVMFLECGDHVYTRLSGSSKHPTKLTSTSVKFLPTTFNAEIISPAFKKFVAVTNVWNSADITVNAKNGDTDCLNELISANGQEKMMEVIEGNKLVVPFTGKAGYKYEILYSALDFEGKVMNRKYYIQF